MAKNNSDMDEWIFRHYVANSLRNLPENKQIIATLDEILHPKVVDTRTGDEIALDVIKKAGLKFKED